MTSSGIEDPPGTTHYVVPLHEQGPALWPGYIGIDDLAKNRRDVGTPIFETMYQGRRGGLAGQIIREEYLRYYRKLPEHVITFMAVDLAISKKTTADETAVVVAAVDLEPPGTMYVRWYWHGRVGIKRQEQIILRAWDHYRPVAIGIEAVAYQAALVELLETDHPELPIEPVKPDRDKISRFLGLARLYEFGRVYHHPSMKASAFEHQITRLPGGRHDDMADALAYVQDMAGLSSGSVTLNERPPGFR